MHTLDNHAGHYAAFEASPALRRVGEKLVWEVEHGNWKQHDALIEVISRFDQESARAYVLDGVAAMEARILAAETAVVELEAALNDPAHIRAAGSKLGEKVAALEAKKIEIERLYARWAELEAIG